jgi:hypothetical protein
MLRARQRASPESFDPDSPDEFADGPEVRTALNETRNVR